MSLTNEQNITNPISIKRLPESPVDDIHKKSKRSESVNSELLEAVRQLMREEVLPNMRKAFTEELDSRLANFALKEEVNQIGSNIEDVRSELACVQAQLQTKDDEINKYKEMMKHCIQRTIQLEKSAKNKNVIFSNIVTDIDAITTAKKICKDHFGMNDELNEIEKASILATLNGKSSILVEFNKKAYVDKIFSEVKNLRGQSLSVQRDLTKEDLEAKKILMALKHTLKKSSPSTKVAVYDTKIKIADSKFNYLNGTLHGNGVDGGQFLKDNYNFDFENFIN
ncbi:hypothetical protein ACFFRR_005356 [Megaselia abdita]